MLGIYNYTVILTYIGFLSGFAGILCALEGNAAWALNCLILAGICDVFDGKVASTKKDRTRSEKRFGIQIDSLSGLRGLCALRPHPPGLVQRGRGGQTGLRHGPAKGLSGATRDQRGGGLSAALRPLHSVLLAHQYSVDLCPAAGGGGLLDALLHPQAFPVRAPQAEAAGVPPSKAEGAQRQ